MILSSLKNDLSIFLSPDYLPKKAAFLLACVEGALILVVYFVSQLLQMDQKTILGWIFVILFMFILFLIAFTIYFILLSNKVVKKSMDEITYSKEKHIDFICMTKDIIINESMMSSSDKKGRCELHHYFKIHNPDPNHVYENYTYRLLSKDDLSDLSDYEIKLDDEIVDPSMITYHKYEQYEYRPGDNEKKTCSANCYSRCKKQPNKRNIEEIGNKIIIPVKIPPSLSGTSTKELSIVERKCPSFPNLMVLHEKSNISLAESIGIMVYFPTHILRLSVHINSLNGYKLICSGTEKNGLSNEKQTLEYDVVDRNDEHVWQHEEELRKWKAIPLLSSDQKSLTWEIHSPKIGYRYRMYFSLEHPNASTEQESTETK